MGESKMPHIRLPENLGIRYAVLPGDPARAERAAGYLKDAKLLAFNREYKSYSGLWNGVPVLVMSTGMGGPSMAIGYAPLSYPAIADHRLLTACEESAREAGYRFHTGIARSHDCLYRDDNPSIYADWAKKGVLASDMETAALFVVGRIRGMKTASILNVVAACKSNVAENIGRYADGEALTAQGEEHEILTAFEALMKLENKTI